MDKERVTRAEIAAEVVKRRKKLNRATCLKVYAMGYFYDIVFSRIWLFSIDKIGAWKTEVLFEKENPADDKLCRFEENDIAAVIESRLPDLNFEKLY